MAIAKITYLRHELELITPDQCPCCHKMIVPFLIDSIPASANYDGPDIYCAFRCPGCNHVFWAKYSFDNENFSSQSIAYSEIIGGEGLLKDFPKEIKEVSPSFCEIYNDAYKAQQHGLMEVVGLGYRRAFEFLIKDYAIFQNSGDKDIIISEPLSQIIASYFPNQRTKDILLRANWLGNDFAHYASKHEKFNIKDLVELIDLAVDDLTSEIKRNKYVNEIKNK